MTRIGSINTPAKAELTLFASPHQVVRKNQTAMSTLCSARSGLGGSLISFMLVPGKFFISIFVGMGKLISKLFCGFCKKSPKKEKLDWREAKDLFSVIFTSAITSREFKTTREKTFYRGLGTLSPAMRDRFYQHVGFALALEENPSIVSRPDQEQYYLKNCTHQRIRTALEEIDSQVVKRAVTNFQEELELKTRD